MLLDKENVSHHNRKLILVFRKPSPDVFSIEYLFHEIERVLQKEGVPLKAITLKKMSTGLLNRLINTLSLLKFRKAIVHITGDVHYAILGVLFSKKILTIHDLGFLSNRSGLPYQILKLFWVTLPCKFADIVTVVSSATKEEVLSLVNIRLDKIRVIHNFIDDIYKLPFQRKGFNKKQPRILQIGTAFNKNIPELIKALERIPCRLVIVGKVDKPLAKLLKQWNIEYETRFKISTEELRKEYIKADFLAYVSTLEGFGMPILEAQSCGLPVLTSNCSSMPEVAGDAAIYANPFDCQSIRNSILEIIENNALREKIIQEGYENIKRFSKEKVVHAYLQICKELDCCTTS